MCGTYIKRGFKGIFNRNMGLAKGFLGRILRLAEEVASEDIVEELRKSLEHLDNAIRLVEEAELVR